MNPSKPQPGERKERGMLPEGPGGNGGKKAENPSTSRGVHSEQPPPSDLSELEATTKELKDKRLRGKNTLQTAKAKDEQAHGYFGLGEDTVDAVVKVRGELGELKKDTEAQQQRERMFRNELAEDQGVTANRLRKAEKDIVANVHGGLETKLEELKAEIGEELNALQRKLTNEFRSAWPSIERKRQTIVALEKKHQETAASMTVLDASHAKQITATKFRDACRKYDKYRKVEDFPKERAVQQFEDLIKDRSNLVEFPPKRFSEWGKDKEVWTNLAGEEFLRTVSWHLIPGQPQEFGTWANSIREPMKEYVHPFYHVNRAAIMELGGLTEDEAAEFEKNLTERKNSAFDSHHHKNSSLGVASKQYTPGCVGILKALFVKKQLETEIGPFKIVKDPKPTEAPPVADSIWTEDYVLKRMISGFIGGFAHEENPTAADGIVRMLAEARGIVVGMPKQQGDQMGPGGDGEASGDDETVEKEPDEVEGHSDNSEPMASESGFTSQRRLRRELDTDTDADTDVGSKPGTANATFVMSSGITDNRRALPGATRRTRAGLARTNVNSGPGTDSEEDTMEDIVPVPGRTRRREKSLADQ